MTLLTLINQRPDEAIQAVINEAVAEARTKWSQSYDAEFPRNGFGIATLMPYHVNAGGAGWGNSEFWSISIAASNTWQDWQNTTLTDDAYVVITGGFSLEAVPAITAHRVRAGGEDMPANSLEELGSLDIARFFWKRPYFVRPGNPYIVRVKAKDAGIELFGHMGYCLGKRAFLITES